jgi:DNA primase
VSRFDFEFILNAYDSQTSFLRKISKFYSHSLKENSRALKYVTGTSSWPDERGISPEMISKFQIGYAGESKDLLEFVSLNNLNEEYLYTTGIFSVINETVYDSFYDRIIFPLHDARGFVIGFSGRVWKKGDVRKKFINTSTTTLFSKSLNLYGLHLAIDNIVKKRQVFVVEGVPDVIACHQAGILNVVAPCGTAITKYQLLILKSIADLVVFVLDNDNAGETALKRAQEICKEEKIKNTSISLQKYKDADEILHLLDAKSLQEAFTLS